MCSVKFIKAVHYRGCFVEIYIGIYNSCGDTVFYKHFTLIVNRSDTSAPPCTS